MRTIDHPNGHSIVVGSRLRSPTYRPRLFLGAYGAPDSALPTPPDQNNYAIAAAMPVLSDILGNGKNGDCTCAGAFHNEAMGLANAGKPLPALTATNALSLYYKLTGGQDTGLDLVTVLNAWMKTGLLPDGSCKISAYADVSVLNWNLIKDASWLFPNGLYMGLDLPDAWVGKDMPTKNGAVWDTAGPPNPDNGHCIVGAGYGPGTFFGIEQVTAEGLWIDTWGFLVFMTKHAAQEYLAEHNGGEIHLTLTPDNINAAQQKAPNNFDYQQLLADIEQFRGDILG